jgi:enoyl-CoA hydratase/carnithine racemase
VADADVPQVREGDPEVGLDLAPGVGAVVAVEAVGEGEAHRPAAHGDAVVEREAVVVDEVARVLDPFAALPADGLELLGRQRLGGEPCG